jgi:ABC-type maltose transport system permease subunit
MAIVQPKHQRWRLLLAHLFLLGLCAAVVFPFAIVLSVSLRPGNFASGSLIPQAISLEHWRYVLGLPYPGPDGRLILPDLPVMRWLWNSIKVAAGSGLVTLLLSTTAAYALARLRFKSRKALLTGLMLMQMFPAVLALVAIYAIFDRLGGVFPAIGLNTHASLVLAYSGGIAMHVWTLKGYYDTLPVEIEEAARVGRRHRLAELLARAAADGPAHPGGRLHAGLHRRDHRIPRGQRAAQPAGPIDPGSGQQALRAGTQLPLGRLRRSGHPQWPAHHSRLPAGPALDDCRPGRGGRQGMSHLINRRHAALAPLAWLGTVGLAGCTTTHTMTSTAPTMDHVPWSRNAAIYEVNLRQFTPEGTLADFQRIVARAHALGMPLIYGGQESFFAKRLHFFERDPIDWRSCPLAGFYAELLALKRQHAAMGDGDLAGAMVVENRRPLNSSAFQAPGGNHEEVT